MISWYYLLFALSLFTTSSLFFSMAVLFSNMKFKAINRTPFITNKLLRWILCQFQNNIVDLVIFQNRNSLPRGKMKTLNKLIFRVKLVFVVALAQMLNYLLSYIWAVLLNSDQTERSGWFNHELDSRGPGWMYSERCNWTTI